MEVLRKVPLFSGLGEADLSAFAELTRERSYPKGSVIVFEDDPGDALFLVAAGQVKVVKIDVDQNPEITQRFRIQAMPTLMVFKDGKVAAQQVGALVQKKKLEDWIKSSI